MGGEESYVPYELVFISFSCNNKNVSEWNRLIAMYSFVAGDIRMTHLIHVLCACGLLQGSHGGVVLHLTHLIYEYHVHIPWNSVPSRGFCGETLVANY